LVARELSLTRDSWILIAFLYVLATSFLIMGGGVYNTGLTNSMRIRMIGFVGRVKVFSQGAKSQPDLIKTAADTISQDMESFVGEKILYERDRLEAGALALVAGSPRLTSLFIGGPILRDKAAASLVAFSFNDLQDVDVQAILSSSLPKYLSLWVSSRIYSRRGNVSAAKLALSAARASASSMIALIEILFFTVLVLGLLGIYFLIMAKGFSPIKPKNGGFGAPRAVAGVFVIFTTVLVTLKIFLAPLLVKYLTLAQAGSVTYLLVAATGIFAVSYMGATLPSDNLWSLLGLDHLDRPKPKLFLQGLSILVAAVFMATILGSGLFRGGNSLGNGSPVSIIIRSSRSDIILLVFFAVFVAPIFEEAFFRGFIFRKLRERFSTWGAAWLSGAIFAFAHMEPDKFIPLMVLGYVFARIYETSQTLLTSILLHSLWNLGMMTTMIALFYR